MTDVRAVLIFDRKAKTSMIPNLFLQIFKFSLFCHLFLFFVDVSCSFYLIDDRHLQPTLTDSPHFQMATPSLKTRTEWCLSLKSSERTTPPNRGPTSGELLAFLFPAGQFGAAAAVFKGDI